MTDANLQALGLLSKPVIALAIFLAPAGMLRHDVTLPVIQRIWNSIVARSSGLLSFRFVLQPAMAAVAAIHDGINDARDGRTPYLWAVVRFWTVAHNPGERVARLREGLIATSRIILLGIAMDVIYQLLEFHTFYPAEALIIALLLAFVPYPLIRGPVTRIARWWHGGVSGAVR